MNNDLQKFIYREDDDLTKSQKRGLDSILDGKNVFITGQGGCGKTYLINRIIKTIGSTRKIAVTSTTGTSALHLSGGTTLHSWAGVGLGTGNVQALCTKIKKKTYLRQRWMETELLIIDEVSMLDPELFDKLNQIAKWIRRTEKPFGGIQLVATGDFLQLPCVGSDLFCFESESWVETIQCTIYLTENMRQTEDLTWRECLSKIRVGRIDEDVQTLLLTRKNAKLSNEHGICPTKLFATNVDVEETNYRKLAKLKGEIREYNAELILYYKKYASLMEKFRKDCSCVQELHLCKNAQVILLCNLELENGLVNGSRGIITHFTEDDLPVVKFLNGQERTIDYHSWELERDDKKVACIEQIPLLLGYAFSIHRSQGCSLDYVQVDLSDVFEYGQAYVALSRVRKISGLSIKNHINFSKIFANPKAVSFYDKLDSNTPD